jgi:threonyl-tRNA synthetase
MNTPNLDTLRHSCAHIMAQAVKELWPGTKLAIGPSIEDGFYYDFDKETPFTDDDLAKIEKKMQQIIKKNESFTRKEVSKKEAVALFKKIGESYKLELLEEIPDDTVSLYTTGKDFTDLCRGPHLASTGEIKACALLSIAGAYWRGSEKNKMLQRIYGTAFFTPEELKAYIQRREEALLRDHRKLGKELEFFTLSDKIGPGLVLYHHKGALLRKIIEDYETREHLRRGYKLVAGPHILRAGIWKESGHYDYYKENMFIFEIEGQEYAIKPMNCPSHIIVYNSKIRSYRDLPLRFFEMGTVYRNEKSGVLHGLLRVRGFTQDDAHIFCLEEQLEQEILGVIDFVIETIRVFGFEEYSTELSTKPQKYIGNDADWEKAERALTNALTKRNIAFDINAGDGAFYGPKIDIKLKDACGRKWQCATIQCDFALPERFALAYTDKDGSAKKPIMLHRVLLGSMERFIGALLEHYKGALPLWLSPEQVRIIPIATEQVSYAQGVCDAFLQEDIRAEVDGRRETMQAKIRDAQKEKIPYMIIIGKKEIEASMLALRSRDKGDEGTIDQKTLIARLKKEIADKNH